MLTLLWPPFLGCIFFSFLSGPLGALIIWMQLNHLSDALAHAAWLGLALAFFTAWPTSLCLFLNGIWLIALHHLTEKYVPKMGSQTSLALISYLGLSLGMICLSYSNASLVQFVQACVGELFAITPYCVLLLFFTTVLVLSISLPYWNSMLSVISNPSLAQVEGISVSKYQWALKILLTLVLSLSLPYFGALIVGVLFTFPAATAHCWAQSPEGVAGFSILASIVSSVLGLLVSLFIDIPAGPCIACISTVLLAASLLLVHRLDSFHNRHAL